MQAAAPTAPLEPDDTALRARTRLIAPELADTDALALDVYADAARAIAERAGVTEPRTLARVLPWLTAHVGVMAREGGGAPNALTITRGDVTTRRMLAKWGEGVSGTSYGHTADQIAGGRLRRVEGRATQIARG